MKVKWELDIEKVQEAEINDDMVLKCANVYDAFDYVRGELENDLWNKICNPRDFEFDDEQVMREIKDLFTKRKKPVSQTVRG